MAKKVAGAFAFVLLILLGIGSSVCAQQDVSALTGVVTDKSGAEISKRYYLQLHLFAFHRQQLGSRQ
jgi:hypothetical protein